MENRMSEMKLYYLRRLKRIAKRLNETQNPTEFRVLVKAAKEIASNLRAQYSSDTHTDASNDDIDWITMENGEHVPLVGGVAIGGPMKGKNFSDAKSTKSSFKNSNKSSESNTAENPTESSIDKLSQYSERQREARLLQRELETSYRDLAYAQKDCVGTHESKSAEDKAKIRYNQAVAHNAELREKMDSLTKGMSDVEKKLFLSNVSYNPVQKLKQPLSHNEILEKVAGGDLTEGSCVSVALAYAAQTAGYDVLDFRGGKSRELFSDRETNTRLLNDLGMDVKIFATENSAVSNAEAALNQMKEGKLYLLKTGRHAACVRLFANRPQYLELQSSTPNRNRWTYFGSQYEQEYILKNRFGCDEGFHNTVAQLVELDRLDQKEDFQRIMGYINTNRNEQKKGANGYAK